MKYKGLIISDIHIGVIPMEELYLQFQTPSKKYNAWAKVGGAGRPVITWTNQEDIVFIVRNDIRAYLDVNVLASAFNMDKATLLGNILTINDFNIYNEDGTLNYDGSAIVGMIADKSWFRIKRQDMFMDSFYNPNNRSVQYYLNNIKMYNMSLFANGVILATEQPEIAITGLEYETSEVSLVKEATQRLSVNVTPIGANTPNIVYTSSNEEVFIVEASVENPRECVITAVGAGTATLTAKAGNVTATVSVTVTQANS